MMLEELRINSRIATLTRRPRGEGEEEKREGKHGPEHAVRRRHAGKGHRENISTPSGE
jgi:hypothetical protein